VRFPSDTPIVSPGSRLREVVARLQRRLGGEEGFTLVELTIVLLIMGILLSVAVPSYLSFKDRASKVAARTDVAQAIRSVASYGADNFPNGANDPNASVDTADSGYHGISLALLQAKYDASMSIAPGAPFVMNPIDFTGDATTFCLTAAVGRWIAVQHGIDSPVQVGTQYNPDGSCTVS
jgi:prepilin-type N-terminal cleavage/methylation domain-containing protein